MFLWWTALGRVRWCPARAIWTTSFREKTLRNFLMTSVQPIDNPEAAFNFEGVRTRGVGPSGPLEKLIQSHAAGTRGALSGVPTNWSIERIPFRSKDPNK